MARAKTEQAEFTTYRRRTLTKIHRWLADTPQSFIFKLQLWNTATAWRETRAGAQPGKVILSPTASLHNLQCCKPIQFCVCVSTLPSRPKRVLECLIQFHSNFRRGANGHAFIHVLPANLSHASSDTAPYCTRRNAKCQSVELVFGK